MSTPAPWQQEEVVDFRVLFAALFAGRKLIIGCVVVGTLACIVAAFVITPTYQAAATLAPARATGGEGLLDSLGQLGGLASLAGADLGKNDALTEESLAVLRSRTFTESFIKDRGLMPKLFHTKWDAKRNAWKKPPGPTPARAYKRFNKVRSVAVDKKTGLVTLQIEWRDRNEAAQWATELVARLNAEMRARAIRDAEASLRFLEQEQLNITAVATREALGRLTESQLKQRMLANVTEEYAFRVVDRALPPDADDPVWPRKSLLAAVGFVSGGVLGSLVVLLMWWWRAPGRGATSV